MSRVQHLPRQPYFCTALVNIQHSIILFTRRLGVSVGNYKYVLVSLPCFENRCRDINCGKGMYSRCCKELQFTLMAIFWVISGAPWACLYSVISVGSLLRPEKLWSSMSYVQRWYVYPTIYGWFDIMDIRCRSEDWSSIYIAASTADRRAINPSELMIDLLLVWPSRAVTFSLKMLCLRARISLTRVRGSYVGMSVAASVMSLLPI